jgi:hypothetical protein
MGQINQNTRFLGVDSSKVNLVEKKDGVNNAKTEYYTAEEIAEASKPYKVYTALLSQSGTNNPTANVFENTISSHLTWVRDSFGIYESNESFKIEKTIVFISRTSNSNIHATISESTFKIIITAPDDDLLKFMPIEIRVYN